MQTAVGVYEDTTRMRAREVHEHEARGPSLSSLFPLYRLSMSGAILTYKVFDGPDIADDQLAVCAKFFSEHYGIWAENAPSPLKPSRHFL